MIFNPERQQGRFHELSHGEEPVARQTPAR
jgi:hypothetical protein